jgi:CelD/BcsL family acetyltransferase involved in cellulose biosynthesis
LQRLTKVRQNLKITVCTSAEELLRLRPLWEQLCGNGKATVFQDFRWNYLAAERFADREQPYVVCAESSNGAAIVPAVLRKSDNCLRLLGEELFDYRSFLCDGDNDALCAALAALSDLGRPLEVVAMREGDRNAIIDQLQVVPFVGAPGVCCSDIDAGQFAAAHSRLSRNLRRMERLGFDLRNYNGSNPQLLRSIFTGKANQLAVSLFHDPARIEFLVSAAEQMPEVFEIFTLEKGSTLAAAVVTLIDRGCRRFYTGWFAPEYEKHSPALALIYEITRQSLAAGLDCDYMTGEQPYKMRLAISSVPLYKVRATPQQLAALNQQGAEHFDVNHAVVVDSSDIQNRM